MKPRLEPQDGGAPAVRQSEEEILRKPGSELMIRRMSDPVPIPPERRGRNQIIEYSAEHAPVVQSFRTMRTLLLQQASAANFVTMVTGMRPGSGASFVARNLAAALAFDESRTSLLVDCNRESPSVDALLGGNVRYGLTDLLEQPAAIGIGDIIHSTGIPRLRAVPIGSHRDRPAEYFTSHRMKAFLDVARRRYPDRYVVVDAPSMQTSADPRILADWCHYVILVVRYGEATRDELLEAVATFPREKFVGVIFNDFDAPPDADDTDHDGHGRNR
ncbi:MAG TPA: polysaccharide biosynthesis protein [Gammaproteobacteria bacterium]